MADMWNSVSDRDYREELMGPDPNDTPESEEPEGCIAEEAEEDNSECSF